MSEFVEDWYSSNRLRSYPIQEDAGTGFPRDLIVDMSICCAADDVTITLQHVSTSPSFVAIVVSADDQPVLALAARVIDLKTETPIALDVIDRNYTGTVVFGRLGNLPSRSYGELPLDFRAVHILPGTPVTSLRAYGASTKLRGVVEILTDGYLESATVGSNVIFSLARNQDAAKLFNGPCENQASSDSCQSPPGRKINEVPADDLGNINLVFRRAPE